MRHEAALRYRLAVVSPLERRLREWGLAFGYRPQAAEGADDEPDGANPIARVSVDRTREGDVERHRGFDHHRPTKVRRKLIQERVGDRCRVPAWAGGDPIRCVETRTRGPEWQPGQEEEQVERIVLELGRWDRRAALALRAAYCLLGRRPLNERVAWVSRASETNVSRLGYRSAVARGRLFVEAMLAGKPAAQAIFRSQNG